MGQGSPTEAFGPYLVYEQLGVGGMAQVHRAIGTTSEFQRPVALKRMLSHIASSEEMVKSFVREARLASYLRHDNVAQTYDLGKVGDIYFIVMELITGRNLREVLRHCGGTTGPMPVQVALNILNQICDALDYAHNLCDETGQPLGIIHRDVSPSNVIVSDGGVVKLIDFGIAKASGAGMQTMSGTLKGKFGYMAPEYIAGRIDARADLFAVGVIAHELLTNRPLFAGRDDIDTLTRVRDMHIDPPSKKNPLVPPEIDDIVMTALQRDPDRRWQHATALRSALTTLTKRLGLIATNLQAIQWLDWAFAQPRRSRRTESDTDRDAGPLADDDPSISIEQLTVELGSASKKITLMATAEPTPATPLEAPSFALAARAGRDPMLPRTTANGVMPATPLSRIPATPPSRIPASTATPANRPSVPAMPSRGHPASAPPPSRAHPAAAVPPITHPAHAHAAPPGGGDAYAPSASPASAIHRTHPASVPPPVAAYRAHPSSTPPPLGPPIPLSSAPLPVIAGTQGRAATQASAPLPVVPGYNTAPFAAPRPSRPALDGRVGSTPGGPAAAKRPLADRVGSNAPETVMSGQTSHLTVVILVILAAAVAATTVYFVLPLLT